MSTVDGTSRVRLRPLVVRPEDGEYVVGSLDNGEFVALPEIGKQAIELLGDEAPLAEVNRRLDHVAGVGVDLAGFVEQLCDLGFVATIDGRPVEGGPPPFRPNLPRLRAGHVRWLFSWPSRVVYVAVVAAAVIAMAGGSGLGWLHHESLFWLDSTSLVMLATLAAAIPLAALHELAHLVAARSLGLPARIGIGTRLDALVVITDVRCMWAVPPRQRYRVYLAGMASDVLMISLAQLVAATAEEWRAPLDALSLVAVLGMLNQFLLYLRTDLYLVATTLVRAKNLYQDASVYAVDRLRRVWRRLAGTGPRPDPLAALPRREFVLARGYAVVMVVGSAVAVGATLVLAVPSVVALVSQALASMRGDGWLGVVDGTGTLAVFAALQGVFVIAFFRGRRERVRRLRERFR
jgi:putative peptide zinc metalloprotease protein